MISFARRLASAVLFAGCCMAPGPSLPAQNLVTIDATAPVPPPEAVIAALGTSRNPAGETLGVSSQYLTRNGKPWLPVMGEFHYSRYPASGWEQELLKMKAAGINIVSTYVIWIHQEQNEGEFNWTGQRDLRQFVELCHRHGLYVVVRIGPWAHGEVRNGGLPDWVLKNSAVRQNDPVYLREVNSFFAQIGSQLRGELWKDGGAVIGVQIENEYNAAGPGKGADHIRTLKAMALNAGLDVPLYTVTGWDGAAIPLDAVLPVFGGYPDAPWAGTAEPMPANEIYAFRFENRSAGSMGALGGHGQSGASSYRGTPFLTAEVGDGIEDTYFRRPVVSADDIASIAPVMLGAGVNLLGYYMFHGGRNPDGGTLPLQESQRSGYPTDVPVRSYDFQAPLGEFGQERESLRKLKLIHYFLNDFGDQLAPMMSRAPAALPARASDASVPRVAARTLGNAGFVFFNNHVRGLNMPDRPDFQVELKLPGETLKLPERPISLPAEAYGIWPLNFSLGPHTLRYSTAQLFKRVVQGERTSFWFFSIPGIAPELLFPLGTSILRASPGVLQSKTQGGVLLRLASDAEATFSLDDKTTVVVLPETRAQEVWRVSDPSLLLLTSAEAFSDDRTWSLLSNGEPRVPFGVFGAKAKPRALDATLHPGEHDLLFQQFVADVPPVVFKPGLRRVSDAMPRGPWTMGPKAPWLPRPLPMAPDDSDFTRASVWTIDLPRLHWSPSVPDAMLQITYVGDVARISAGGKLLDDNFWNGLPWTLGLRDLLADVSPSHPPDLQLRVLPLPQAHPMYLENPVPFPSSGESADQVESIHIVPQYRIMLEQPTSR